MRLAFTGHRPESLPFGENELSASAIRTKTLLADEIIGWKKSEINSKGTRRLPLYGPQRCFDRTTESGGEVATGLLPATWTICDVTK